jgi:hypothetical protein
MGLGGQGGSMSLLMPRKRIEQTILMIRGLKVMLDHDLAELHGVTAGRLNEVVKKERRLVSGVCMFQLTRPEFENLKSQIAISNSKWGIEDLHPLPAVFETIRELIKTRDPETRRIGFKT